MTMMRFGFQFWPFVAGAVTFLAVFSGVSIVLANVLQQGRRRW